MSQLPPSRRGFLRGLVSLPLIGGGVTLIGQPTAAAVPVTEALLDRYIEFLAHEHAATLHERYPSRDADGSFVANLKQARMRLPMMWLPEAPPVEGMIATTRPSSRAAVVLSAVGVPLPRD